jgi:hypothetical protein
MSDYGVYGYSQNSTGAYFEGDGGIALELGGSNSVYGEGTDDAVIRSQVDQAGGDLVLVSNDVIAFHLDDDNDTDGSELEVRNGANTRILILDESGNLTITGTYSPSSDINRKEEIIPVATHEILTKVASLPISEWQFKGEAIRHIGPMAQDFSAAFGLGANNTTIATVDSDGVALAAIQALAEKCQRMEKKLTQVEEENLVIKNINRALTKKLEEVEERFQKLESLHFKSKKER